MDQNKQADYKKLFTELIQKQIAILGPEITLARVRNLSGLTVDSQGVVTLIEGDPKILLKKLVDEFVDLSGLIIKKTMESILVTYPFMAQLTTSELNTTNASHSEQQVHLVDPQTSLDQKPPAQEVESLNQGSSSSTHIDQNKGGGQ